MVEDKRSPLVAYDADTETELIKVEHNFINSLRGKSNAEVVIAEAFLLKRLSDYVKGRQEEITKLMLEHGIYFNPKVSPRAPGTYTLHESKHFTVVCTVKKPAVGLDQAKLKVELAKYLPADKVAKVLKAAEKTNAAAHSFSIAYKGK